MRGRNTDVFVEMKKGSLRPIDVLLDELVKKLKLRCSSCGNQIGLPARGDCLADTISCSFSSRPRQLDPGIKDCYVHLFVSNPLRSLVNRHKESVHSELATPG